MSRLRMGASMAVVAALAMVLTGCYAVPVDRTEGAGTQVKNVDVALQGAATVDAKIEMGLGELKVGSSSTTSSLVSGTMRYPQGWPAEVAYEVSGSEGELRLSQERGAPLGEAKNSWDLTLAQGVPMRLSVAMGAGASNLNLGGLDLDDLQVMLGAGEATIDLTGPRTRDLPVSIQAGVGEFTLVVPSDVGVRVSGRNDGLGDFNANGFTAQDNAWVNDAWSGTGPKIDVDLQRGVGDVTIESRP